MGNTTIKKPLIGIVSKPVRYPEEPLWQYDELVDDLRYLLVKNGATAIGILPTANTMTFVSTDNYGVVPLPQEELDDLRGIVDICDGILLEGGMVDSLYEVEVARYTIERDLPVLGICDGFNNLILALGGRVSRDASGRHQVYAKEPAHKLLIEKGSRLHALFGENEILVNSLHTMIASDADIREFTVTAHSDDGLVEAIELEGKRFVMGVKWHPEIMIEADPRMNGIFAEFVAACGRSGVSAVSELRVRSEVSSDSELR